MALTDFLKQIADSIRSKDGTTEPIVASTFPQRILDIPSGSGGLFDVYNGEFVLSYDHNLFVDNTENNFILNHNIGKVPFAMILYCDPSSPVHSVSTIVYALYMPPTFMNSVASGTWSYHELMRINGSTNVIGISNNQTSNKDKIIEMNDTQMIIGKGVNVTTYNFRSGNTYKWIALVEKGSAS